MFPNATKWEKVQSPFQCIFARFSGECSKMGEMGKAWRAEVSILRGVGEGHCV